MLEISGSSTMRIRSDVSLVSGKCLPHARTTHPPAVRRTIRAAQRAPPRGPSRRGARIRPITYYSLHSYWGHVEDRGP